MRNLKRVLSLALATFMLIGMMAVGAGAVDTYNDFTDKDEIVNTDAVSLLVTLGVINGKEDGSSFDPTGNVTRAEMAKMISTILNRGTDINNQYAGMKNGLTDVASNWAVGHINYCYTLGIIAGRGDGRFDPTANVTAAEAAKMLLVAAGYDANIQGLVGANWDTQTSALASRLGVFDNFTKDITLPLNRDDAALLIYNFLDIEMIQSYSNEQYPIVYADHRTVLSFAYGVIKVEGVVTGNEWAVLDGDVDSALQTGKTRITNPNGIFSTTTNTTVGSGEANVTTQIFNIATPEEYLGRSVTMYIRKTTILADSIVYATPVIKESNVIVSDNARIYGGKAGDDNKSLASVLRGTGLTVNDDTQFYVNYGEVRPDYNSNTEILNRRGAALTVIDNNDDGFVDYVLSKQKSLTHVSAVSSKNETTTLYDVEVVNNDDLWTPEHKVLAEALKKEDVVLFVQYGGRTYVEYPDTVTGEMDHFNAKNRDTNQQYMVVDSTQYKGDDLEVLNSQRRVDGEEIRKFYVKGCDSETQPDGTTGTGLKGVEFKATYEFFLDDYDNIIAFRQTEKAPTNYALVLESAYSVNGLRYSGDMKLLLNDGTTKTVKVDIDASANSFKSMDENAYKNNNDTSLRDWYGYVVHGDTTTPEKITNSNKREAVMAFMGTDDGGYNNASYLPSRNAAAGNLIAYTYNEAEDTITFRPAALDLGAWVNGRGEHYTQKLGPNDDDYFFGGNWPTANAVLTADLDKGDTDLFYNIVTTSGTVDREDYDHDVSFGIDEDTIVYYYDGEDGAVVKGYSAMAKSIKYDGVSGYEIDQDAVAVSAVYFNDDTDVAEVVVVYTSQAKFGNDDYVYVMSVYNKYKDGTYVYSVIDKEGNVLKMRSDDEGMAGKLCLYEKKSDDKYDLIDQGDWGWMHEQDSAYALGTDASLPSWHVDGDDDVHNDRGLIVTTRNKYIKVYDFNPDDGSGTYLDDDDTVARTFVDDVDDNTNTYYLRYADKALIIDVENTDEDDEKAATTTAQNGQYAIVVYNDNNQAEVVYVLESFKWDADPQKEPATTKRLDELDIDGNYILGNIRGYNTQTDAVNNAYELELDEQQLQANGGRNEVYAIYDDSYVGTFQIAVGSVNNAAAARSWRINSNASTGWVTGDRTDWNAALRNGNYIIVAVDDDSDNTADVWFAFKVNIV